MCVNLPVKIISVRNNKIIAQAGDQKKEVSNILTGSAVKKGDYVFLKDRFITGKINQKQAKEIFNLCMM